MSGAIMQDDIEKGWNVFVKLFQKYHKKFVLIRLMAVAPLPNVQCGFPKCEE